MFHILSPEKPKLAAVILDTRKTGKIKDVIDQHMSYLPGWDCLHISDTRFLSIQEFQLYLLTHNFWKRLAEYDTVLIFQADSEILRSGMDEFLEYNYSYIGAPWRAEFAGNTPDRRGGNGGISLRDVKAHLKVTKNRKPRATREWEDVWFSRHLPNVAPYEVCKKFSVESDFSLGSMCAHAIDKYLTTEECVQIRTQYSESSQQSS